MRLGPGTIGPRGVDMGKKKKKSQADLADRYALYQKAVQLPEHEVAFLQRVYLEQRDKAPKVLREDFCAAAAVCAEWVKSGKDKEAWGIDIDPEPLAWGQEHNIAPLKSKEQDRVHPAFLPGQNFWDISRPRTKTSPMTVSFSATSWVGHCFGTTTPRKPERSRAPATSGNKPPSIPSPIAVSFSFISNSKMAAP
jgi:hypothetical protein